MSQQGVHFVLAIPFVGWLIPDKWFVNREWGDKVVEHLAKALLRKVKVRIVVASEDGAPTGYSGPSAANLFAAVEKSVTALVGNEKSKISAVMCRLQVAPLRFSDEQDPYAKSIRPGNHAKMFIVDDNTAYVGSHNLYPSEQEEFGFIIDDGKETGKSSRSTGIRCGSTRPPRRSPAARTCRRRAASS